MRDKEEIERTNTSVIMNNAFETGEILDAPEETLQKYLQHLCTGRVPNEEVRHREIIRALTINHIQAQRHLDNLTQQTEKLQQQAIALQEQNNTLQKRNITLQRIVIVLTILAGITGIIQVYTALKVEPRHPSVGILSQEKLSTPTTSSETPTSKTGTTAPTEKPKETKEQTKPKTLQKSDSIPKKTYENPK
jgi:hypothetical protein